jgi:ABC-type glucose/galactose transport system permease subunit
MATSRATAIAQSGSHRTLGVVSLAVGPLVMAVGDLLHPKETPDITVQAAIVAEQATRWYLAHLLLFLGLVLFVPGLLTLADLAAARRPRVGDAARMLVVIGVAGLAATFVAEMLAGRFGALGAAATEELLNTTFSGPIAGPVLPVVAAFFVAAAVFALPLIAGSGPLRWPAVVLLAGVLLILAEIVSAQVLLSQIGNFLVWGGSVAFAWLLVRGEVGAPAAARAGQAHPAG